MTENGETIGVMDVEMAKKIVKYVKGHPNSTWVDVANNVPGLRNRPELREFALEGAPSADAGFLVKIDENGIVSLGPAAHLVD